MYFYGFCQTVWLFTGTPVSFIYTSFFKKLYTYDLSILYCYQLLNISGRISSGAIISHQLKT